MKLTELESSHVYYHGSTTPISQFKGVSYFTTDLDAAEGYARGKASTLGIKQAFLYKVRLGFSKPFVFDSMQQIGSLTPQDIIDFRNEGYDAGVFYGNKKSPIPEFVPFYPENVQILSVMPIKL